VPVPPPLALYVHLPWCVRKCPYCDFNSYTAESGLPAAEYVAALLRDLDAELPLLAGRTVASVFFGGGTPSLFPGESVAALLAGIAARVPLASGAEVTLEANPGTAEAGRFAAYRRAGVNRLSLGVQSFRDGPLARLGRIHSGSEAVAAYRMARDAGFANVNLDLMYGLPEDDAAGAIADLEQALALEPEHLSRYQLTLEPDTAFHRQPPRLPDEDAVAAMEATGQALLAAGGYERYEVSAYAQAGQRCHHNLNYWHFGDYAGIGAGAHGKLTGADGVVTRRMKARNPRRYLVVAGTPDAVTSEAIADPGRLTVEFMMNALRLRKGVPLALFIERTGLDAARIEEARGRAERLGLLERRRHWLVPTAMGYRFLNDLIGVFDPRSPADRERVSAVAAACVE
jgi:oxygen-independent coproporphyrinogen-3 oxidase